MRYAIVKDGVVINTAISDSPINQNWIPSDEAGVGWLYVDGVFVNPADQPPVMNLGGGGGPIEPG